MKQVCTVMHGQRNFKKVFNPIFKKKTPRPEIKFFTTPTKEEYLDIFFFLLFQISHPEAYGQLSITSNGQSLMNFQMDLKAVTIMNNVPVKWVDVASWEGGLNKPLDVVNGPKMVQHSAVTVYRIVTVVVSGFLTSL